MSARARELVVGDVVYFVGLHQSRTGLIVRAPVCGQVLTCWPGTARLVGRPSAMTLELHLEDGTVRSFQLKTAAVLLVRERAAIPSETRQVDPHVGP